MLNKSSMEETLIMIKPDAMLAKNAGAIITILEKSEFKLKKSKIFRMDDEFVKKFYAEHIGKEFFPGLKKFMQSGPIMAIVLERENAIKYLDVNKTCGMDGIYTEHIVPLLVICITVF